jgi:RNA polymerase sigma-B factor
MGKGRDRDAPSEDSSSQGALTEAEERELFTAYRESPSEELTTLILKQYENLVYHIAHKYSPGRESFEDLVQVGMIGLVQAIRRFDVDKGWRFSTYAYQTIRGEIQRYFRDKSWAMSVPRQTKEQSLKVFAVESMLALKLGCSPTPSQIAEEAGLTEEQVLEAMELGSAYHPMNILEEAVSEETAVSPTIRESPISEVESDLFWQHMMAFLTPKEADVIRLRFWDGLPQRDVAIKLNTSQMNVSRLQRQALAKLRKLLRTEDLPF